MYTNWPFTAKTNTHTIHMSEIFAKGGFSTETDVSVKSSHAPYVKVKSQGRGYLQLPNTSTEIKMKKRSETQLDFQIKNKEEKERETKKLELLSGTCSDI